MTEVSLELRGVSESICLGKSATSSQNNVPTVVDDSFHRTERSPYCTRDSTRARERHWSVVLSCTVATMLQLTTGINISISSNLLLDLARGDSLHQLTLFQQSVFTALSPVGAIFSGLVGGWIADHYGRKCSLMLTGVPVITGYLLISYAHFSTSTQHFVFTLYAGRLLTGAGMGSASAVLCVYTTEVSSAKLRGLFGGLNEFMVMGGITLNFALGSIDGFFYHHISLVAVGIVAVFEVLMFWLPETPRSLLSRGYVKEAETALQWLRGPKSPSTDKEFEEIKQKIIASRKYSKKTVWRSLRRKSVFIPFIYVIVVFLVKQFCGINAILAYAGEIFVDAGVSNPRSTAVYSVGVSNMVGIVAALLLVDTLGRKTLLAASGILMMVGLTLLGIHFYITGPLLCSAGEVTLVSSGQLELVVPDAPMICNAHFAPLAIVSLIIYDFGFSLGFGPLAWVLASELLPLSVRGKAAGLCMVVSFASSTVVVGSYLELVELGSPWFVLWAYGLVSLAGAVFVLVFIPETKGRSLEAVEREFDEGKLVALCL